MKHYFLPEKGSFYKANLHCHSTYSDGKLTPEELKKAYKGQGYSILAITDHEAIFDHGYLDDEDFLTLPGYEREINKPAALKGVWNSVVTCHMCFYPKDRSNINCVCFDPDFIHPKFKWMHNPELKAKVSYIGEPYKVEYKPECINHIIEQANQNGFIVTLNHLQWSQERYEEFSQYKDLFAMEVYNSACEKGGLNEYNSQMYDMMLRLGNKMKCVAADDSHSDKAFDSYTHEYFGGYVMIKAEELKHENIINALCNGEFYSSTGPEIKELYLEDGKIHIKTSPAKKIRLLSGNRYSKVLYSDNAQLTEAQFDYEPVFNYFRIEVIDKSGEKAYTNAYFTEDVTEME